jgi:hypothetical protein
MRKPFARNAMLCTSAVVAATFAHSARAGEGSAASSAQAEMQMMDTDHDSRVSEDEHTAVRRVRSPKWTPTTTAP